MTRFNDAIRPPRAPRLPSVPKLNDDASPPPKKNPIQRYNFYGRAYGLSGDEIFERDKRLYPAWPMGQYVKWIDQKWIEWHTQNGRDLTHNRYPAVSREEHAAFDAWLDSTLPEVDDDDEEEDFE